MMQEKDAKGAAEEMKRILVTGFEPFGGVNSFFDE